MKLLALIVFGLMTTHAGMRAQAEPAPIHSATQAATPSPTESRWRIGAALGYGERTNPLLQSERIPILIDLDVAWFGDRWFFDNGDIGYSFVDNDVLTTSAVARVNSDRVFFGETNARFVRIGATGATLPDAVELRVPDRDYAVELGVEILADGDWGNATVSAFQDVSGAHDGFEVSAQYSRRWNTGRWSVTPSVGARYKSAKRNDYFWGVRADEASGALPAYRASDGIAWQVEARANYFLTRHTRIALAVSYDSLDAAIADSPIVTRDHVLGYFAGFAYRFR
jgi:outer membrane protein